MIVLGMLLIAATIRPALAVEPICPGGSNPRPDIVWCADYSNLANCKTGLESACWNDNGGLGDPYNGYAIKFGDGPSTTKTAADGLMPPGGSGAGYNAISFPSKLSSASFRWYVKWDHGFLHNANETSHHFPTLTLRNGAGTCYSFISGDYNAIYGIGWMSENSGCGPESAHFASNLAPTVITDNFWHIIEMQVVLDTACTDSSQIHGCNGVWRAWFDGTKVLEYTDFNFRGWAPDAMIEGSMIPRSQYSGAPAWGEHELYGNIAVSNGAAIGRAANEGPLGTPDPMSPYAVYDVYDGEAGTIQAGDCSPSGYLGHVKTSNQWRSGATLETTVTHGLYTGPCIAQDEAMQVSLAATASGGGQGFERVDGSPQMAVHGWIYLPSANDYSIPPALSGFAHYGNDGSNWSKYVAMSVINGQWGVIERPDGGSPQVVVKSGTVTFNAWHEFELMLFQDNTVSLMIDRSQLILRQALPASAAWSWSEYTASNPGPSSIVVGVIDFQGSASAAAPFTAYYDDIDVGAVSFWSCTGWGAASCPFGNGAPPPPDTTAPVAPTGLRAI